MRKILKNGKVITPLRVIENAGVIVENGVIEQIIEGGYTEFQDTDLVIDVKDNIFLQDLLIFILMAGAVTILWMAQLSLL